MPAVFPSTPTSAAPTAPTSTLTLARHPHPETDLEVRRSHFLARAARTDSEEEARAFIASVRAAHPTARHHCSAFIVSIPGALPIERSSDDGEPSGTAGQPMLEVLRATGLTNTTVVVTRYFGGTLLGTGGLVRAYSDATSQGLAAASRVRLTTRYLWEARVPVTDAGRLEAELRARQGLSVEETIWGPTHAVVQVATDSPDSADLAELLASLTRGETVPEPAGNAIVELPV